MLHIFTLYFILYLFLQNINKNVDEQLRLAPYSLLETVPNLGLIAFEDENVRHQKLCIPGHHTPPKELAERCVRWGFLDLI
ncbi:GH23650 [Drosophila grimshawi]|uniref:GH23650 n=1 Tax=Drosophila grimshawi TaxID=7222 RepID=B4K456_DROGR|nr:GH23650 [Drosophila grimshawi]